MTFSGRKPTCLIAYFVYSVACGALRWEARGATLTAAAALAVFVAVTLYGQPPGTELFRAVITSVPLMVLAGLLAFFSAHHPRVERELLALASWPHRLPNDLQDVAAEIIERAHAILPARQIVLMWEMDEAETTTVVTGRAPSLQWSHEMAGRITQLIPAVLQPYNFQAPDATQADGRLLVRSRGRYRELQGPGLAADFAAHLSARTVQSAVLDGEHVKGRLLWIDQTGMRLDDLVVGALIARLAAARLDGVFLLARLEESAVNKERLKVARHLHDSVMQMLTGTALQLTAATRLIDHEAIAARTAAVGGARTDRGSRGDAAEFDPPAPRASRRTPAQTSVPRSAPARTHSAARRAVAAQAGPGGRGATRSNPRGYCRRDHLDRARGGPERRPPRDASHVHVSFRITPGALADEADVLRLSIRDDGRGFPFTGELGLDQLDARGEGPVTLKERVLALGADLRIKSSSAGAELVVTFARGWERDAGGDTSDPRR